MKRRKQSIKFRPRYAGQRAKELSRKAVTVFIFVGVIGASVVGFSTLRRAWEHNDAFKIRDVILQGDIPPALEAALPFDKMGNIIALRPSKVERLIMNSYPELKSLSVRRTWSRVVVISGHFRTPVAWYDVGGKTRFIDDKNFSFTLPSTVDTTHLPQLKYTKDDDRSVLLDCLKRWNSRHSAFSSQIARCETDTIHRLEVTLADGTVINWGVAKLDTLDLRTQRIVQLKEQFHPIKTPAHLTFVTDDRLVMDTEWASNKAL